VTTTSTDVALEREAPREAGGVKRFLSNPWGKPRFLAGFTWLYIVWSLAPLVIAVQISFNAGRSRSVFQGFSLQWYQAILDPGSPTYDDTLLEALLQSLRVSFLTMPIATVLGVALAIGLARWRGRGAGAANTLMLFPLVTPELVMGTGMFLIFVNLFDVFVKLGTTAQVLGLVTFSISYVVIVTRGRLFAIGRELEEAAMDLGASPAGALRRVLLPLLAPAIFSSLFIVFAIAIDDFVISQFLCIADCTTIPMRIYAAARNAGNPGLNAVATIMMATSLLAVTCAVLIIRRYNRKHGSATSAVEDFARLEI
jgi:spermidine/putrescine transport system permease protein